MKVPNSFINFQDIVSTGAYEPTLGNLYAAWIGFPLVFAAMEGWSQAQSQEIYKAVNYFADNVTIPSRGVTTGDIKNVGVQRTYATGQIPNELTISFITTKNMWHRNFFEKWMQAMAPDSENRVGFYDDYTADIFVEKWERGSNVLAQKVVNGKKFETRMNRAVGVFQFVGCFPTNMGQLTFTNEQNGLVKMDVVFKFERYRFSAKIKKPNEWTNDTVLTEDVLKTMDDIKIGSAFGV